MSNFRQWGEGPEFDYPDDVNWEDLDFDSMMRKIEKENDTALSQETYRGTIDKKAKKNDLAIISARVEPSLMSIINKIPGPRGEDPRYADRSCCVRFALRDWIRRVGQEKKTGQLALAIKRAVAREDLLDLMRTLEEEREIVKQAEDSWKANRDRQSRSVLSVKIEENIQLAVSDKTKRALRKILENNDDDDE